MSNQRLHVLLLTLLSGLVLPGCTATRTFERPLMDLPDGTTVEQSQALRTHTDPKWWEVFHDRQLNRLEEQALLYNRDLVKAAATVEKAVALSNVVQADLFPQADIGAGATREEVTRGQQYSQRLSSRQRDIWQMSGVLSYELDLWGKLSSRSDASKADVLSSIAARDAVRMRLTAEVAAAYISIRIWQEKCRIISRVHDTYEKSCSMHEKRFAQGEYPELELRRVQAERAKTLAQLKKAENELVHAETVLAVLIGDSPRQIMSGRNYGASSLLSQAPPATPSGIPSDLLNRRPDVFDLESRLLAAHYREQSARADRFPTISLTGRLGQSSTALDNILRGGSRLFSLDAGVMQYLFDGGRRRASIRVASAEYHEIEAAYEQTVLNAYREVRDALTERTKSDEIYRAVEDEVERTQRSWDIASKQYEAGYIGLMDILDIHRSLLSCELDKAEASGMRLTSVVQLCKALGGGWKNEKFDK